MSLNWSDYQNYLVIGEFTMINKFDCITQKLDTFGEYLIEKGKSFRKIYHCNGCSI